MIFYLQKLIRLYSAALCYTVLNWIKAVIYK